MDGRTVIATKQAELIIIFIIKTDDFLFYFGKVPVCMKKGEATRQGFQRRSNPDNEDSEMDPCSRSWFRYIGKDRA